MYHTRLVSIGMKAGNKHQNAGFRGCVGVEGGANLKGEHAIMMSQQHDPVALLRVTNGRARQGCNCGVIVGRCDGANCLVFGKRKGVGLEQPQTAHDRANMTLTSNHC